MTPARFLVLLVVCLAWGFHLPVVKATVPYIPPFTYVALRMTTIALILSPFLRWHKGRMRRVLAAGACFGGVNYAFMFSGISLIPASVGAIVIEAYVPITMVLSVVFLGETVGWRRGIGAAIAMAGVAIIVIGGANEESGSGDSFILGGSLILGAAVAESLGAILVKRIEEVPALQLLGWFAIVGAAIIGPIAILHDTDPFAFLRSPEATRQVAFGLTYSVLVASIIGHASYYWLIQRVEISLLSPSTLLTTVIAMGAGLFFLGEPLTFSLILGAVTTLGGVAIILVRNRHRRADAPPAPIQGARQREVEGGH